MQVLDSLEAVVDVGGVYDAAACRFDHHQKGFSDVLGHGFSTKLSSAGLVYKVGERGRGSAVWEENKGEECTAHPWSLCESGGG